MDKNIFNVYVEMESQEQFDRMKQLCIDNGLPIWKHRIAFRFDNKNNDDCFNATKPIIKGDEEFFVFPKDGNYDDFKGKSQATETEFIELLKQHKNG